MKKQFEVNEFFASMSESDRLNAMDAASDRKTENYKYYRGLKTSELREKMEQINQLWQEIKSIEEEKKELTAQAKPLKAESESLHIEVSQKQLQFEETVWQVNNEETGRTELLNSQGQIIDSWRYKEGTQLNMYPSKAVNE